MVRAAGPQGANVRQAANCWGSGQISRDNKGRRLYLVSVSKHLRIAYARSPGRLSRRALSPSLADRALYGAVAAEDWRCAARSNPAHELYGLCIRVCLVQCEAAAKFKFPPRRMLRWGLYNALQVLSLRGGLVPEQAHIKSTEECRRCGRFSLPRVAAPSGRTLEGLEPSRRLAPTG